MKRRNLLGFGLLGAIAAACGVRVAQGSGNRYYQGPPSDHFDGTRFFNPGGTPPRGGLDLLRWQFDSERRVKWPNSVESPFAGEVPPVSSDRLRVTMVGHATLLIQIAGRNILTDPVWSKRVSPFSFAGPARVVAPGIAWDDLPKIDTVLLSHNHYDHLDTDTLTRLVARDDPVIFTPLGNDTIVRNATSGARLVAMDWGDRRDDGALTVHLDPCHHWSARGTSDRRMALWGTFTLEIDGTRIVFVGDTGFDDGRPYRALARHGAPDLLILPIGAYEPRWFMQGQHQNPAEAVEGIGICGAKAAIGHHWGTFQLTDEGRQTPVNDLTEALAAKGIPADRVRALQAGEVWEL